MPAIRGSCIKNSAELVSISMFSNIILFHIKCLSLPSLPACAFGGYYESYSRYEQVNWELLTEETRGEDVIEWASSGRC